MFALPSALVFPVYYCGIAWRQQETHQPTITGFLSLVLASNIIQIHDNTVL